jgi:hypothetical protein
MQLYEGKSQFAEYGVILMHVLPAFLFPLLLVQAILAIGLV